MMLARAFTRLAPRPFVRSKAGAFAKRLVHYAHTPQPASVLLPILTVSRRWMTAPTAPTATAHTNVFQASLLKGSCECGSVGFEGRGPSAINFVCHCSICRGATGRKHTAACGFKPENFNWVNEANIERRLPPNSKNGRYYCKSCNGYVGEDATRVLGVYALPLFRVKGSLADMYQPNHHIFYADRVDDVSDAIPKWKTLPEGQPVPSTSASAPAASASTAHVQSERGEWEAHTGYFRKDVQPLSPTRGPEPKVYHFTESDPWPNHVSLITPEKVQERVARKYYPSPGAYVQPKKSKRDVIIIGGGHNGLVSAAYLSKAGADVLLLERRHLLGGAAVTEELYPGFKFSRASYLAGLFRPKIIEELKLEKYGFKYLTRDPSSFTPTKLDSIYKGKYLLLGADAELNRSSISQFSQKDAEAFEHYEDFLGKVREIVSPLLDGPLPDFSLPSWSSGHRRDFRGQLSQVRELLRRSYKYKEALIPFYELFTAPASHILDRYFESEILKTTLATDAVIGASCSPKHAGSAYVLLHHVMGEAAGRKGVWSYVQGGMGAISNAVASAARDHGAEMVTNATVKRILYDGNRVTGVEMLDGSKIEAKVVLSNATPYHTFLELLPGLARDSGFEEEHSPLPRDFVHHIRFADYSCGAVKINCAVDRLPNFSCYPTAADGQPGPQHRGTVHFETRVEEIENAQREAAMGIPATRPVIEMTIPSSLDKTISPPGKHVVQFFVQFAPYDLDPQVGNWADPRFQNQFADRVFRVVDEYCPGFSSSVLYRDIVTPLELERIFGLHRGNIMHGALSLHQLAYTRPAFGYARHRTPLQGLYLCGAGAHPGGGVMGAAGKNCANVVMSDLNLSPKY